MRKCGEIQRERLHEVASARCVKRKGITSQTESVLLYTQPTGITPFSFGNVSDLEILWNQSQSSACRWLCRYGAVSADSLSLLREMAGEYPENIKLHFPGSLYNLMDKAEVEDQVKFLVLTLDHIIKLMDASEHMDSEKWKTKTVEYFLKDLHRQSSELKECVAQYQKPLQKESYEIRINRHFRNLKKILKKEKYSAHAWEQIRKAVKSQLQRMDIIAHNAKKGFCPEF